MCTTSLRVVSLRVVKVLSGLLIICATLISSQQTTNAQTLRKIKERGNLICGVNPNLLGFASHDEQGRWAGFDVDFCRALAAAIFDDPQKVQFVPTETTDRLQVLQSGRVDILSRNTSWAMSREMPFDLNFATVTYYDGQGFLVQRKSDVTSALELDGASLCVQSGTTSELNVEDYFSANNMKHQIMAFPNADQARNAYDSGRCNVLSSDTSQLFAERLKLSSPDDHVVLPDIISKEPLGPAVHFGDDQWLNIVKWTHFAMLNAEELGVSSETLDLALKSEKPAIKRLVGSEGKYGEDVGLTQDWAVRIIRHVGNYAEVFERNVGIGSKLNIPRGINSLWTAGGIQYAPPIR